MENFIIYIVKASALMAVFILAYHAFLRKETFFNANRWYLLAGLATSALLPLVTYTKVVWVQPAPAQYIPELSLSQLVVMQQIQQNTEPTFTLNWFYIIFGVYLAGTAFFLIRFVIDILSLKKLIKGQPVVKEGHFLLVDSPTIRSPFSFFNYIVYNSAILKPEELANILTHEKVHSSQKHSLDMIISQLFCVVLWFNPFTWMYKKSIAQNLEFIADAEATKQIEDKKAYQKTLLKITVHPECIAITNHFYQSLIKKRIVMLNKKQSKKRNSWKYVLVLPALAAFMLAFQVKTVAQVKNDVLKPATVSKISIEVNKDSKDKELQTNKELIKSTYNADVNFENIKRNQKEEITAIKVTVNDQGTSQVYEVAGNSPISPFTIEIEKDKAGRNNINFGTGNSNFQISANDMLILRDNFKDRGNDSAAVKRNRIIRSYDLGDVPSPQIAPFAPPAPPSKAINIGNDDILVVIDGVKKGKGEAAMKGLRSNEIASITILKNKDAKKKYGKDAKDGVIEITTQKSADRLIMRHPNAYRIEIPDIPKEAFSFNFDIPEMQSFNFDFGNIEDFEGAFLNGEFFSSEQLSPEEREKIREDVKKAREEVRKKIAEMDYNKLWEGQQFKRESREESRKEMEEARKELEKARKEVEEARKELEKTRQQFNKKA